MKDLLEKRDKAAKAYRDLIKEMQDAERAPGADDRSKVDNMLAEIDTLDAQIREAQTAQAEKVREMDEALQNMVIGERTVVNPVETREKEDRESFLRFLRSGDGIAEQRAMTTTSDSTGGYLVPEKFFNELKEYQKDLCPIYDLATKSTWDADAVFPVVSAFGETTIVSEGSEKTGVTPTIAQVNLTGFQFIYMVDVPETLIRKSAFNIDEKLAGWWAKSHASVAEDNFAEGTGTTMPYGLAAKATAGTDSAENDAIAANDVVNWYFDLKAQYRKRASWIFADSTIALIRKITNTVTTSGALNYVWMPGLGATPDTLMGKPIYASDGFSSLTAGDACGVFGDISEFQIVEFGKPSLIRDPYTVANYGQVRFVGYRLIDSDLPVKEAVITCAIVD
jgi:HK97 family phage major capsid protein